MFFFKIQIHPVFNRAVLVFIVLNTLVLFMKWYEQPTAIDLAAENLNYMFVVIFISEAIVKIIAMMPKVYFSEGWNIFDFTIIIGSFVSLFVSANTTLEIRGAITIIRSFRILRLLRLIKLGKNLQLIFNTFVITLHSLANIGGLLLLFIFMYAILGMIIFGSVRRVNVMNDYINFENFSNSFMTLFIVATGDSWNEIQASFCFSNSPQT
jgi:Ion transport protein